MIDLKDRVVIVTGGSRGVGRGIAEGLAELGARIVIGDVRVEAGEAVAKGIGGAARFEALDVAREEDWARVVQATVAREGRIDALVNNAAALHIGTIEETPPDIFRRIQAPEAELAGDLVEAGHVGFGDGEAAAGGFSRKNFGF